MKHILFDPYDGAGIAQSVKPIDYGLDKERTGFNSQKGQGIYLLSTAFRPAL
jgi:hypothetical protein